MSDFETLDYQELVRTFEKANPDLQFNADLGDWIVYRNGRWESANELVQKLTSQVYAENAHRKRASSTQIQQAIRAHLTRGDIPNRDATWLLNTPTGVVDLSRFFGIETSDDGQRQIAEDCFVPHSTQVFKSNILTEMTAATFNPNCPPPIRFIQFVRDFFQDDEPTIRFFWRFLASTLVGDTSDHTFFIIFGSGANGKSTLLRVLEGVLGSYFAKEDPSFLQAKADTNLDGIKSLHQKRFKRLVVLDEPSAKMELDVPFMKRITGEDSMPIPQRLRKSSLAKTTFQIQAKIIMDTNHLPNIKHVEDEGLWRRLVLLPARPPVPHDQRKPDLTRLLLEEKDAILTYIITGHIREWYEYRLKPVPPKVAVSATMFRFLADPVRFFIKNTCTITEHPLDKGLVTRSEQLWQAYLSFCRSMTVKISGHLGLRSEADLPFLTDVTDFGSNRRFSSILEERFGALKGILNGRHYWRNVLYSSRISFDRLLTLGVPEVPDDILEKQRNQTWMEAIKSEVEQQLEPAVQAHRQIEELTALWTVDHAKLTPDDNSHFSLKNQCDFLLEVIAMHRRQLHDKATFAVWFSNLNISMILKVALNQIFTNAGGSEDPLEKIVRFLFMLSLSADIPTRIVQSNSRTVKVPEI